MKIILPSAFPQSIADELGTIQFDVLRTAKEDLAELCELSVQEKRILFLQNDRLPARTLGPQNAHGIIALDEATQTLDGFRQFVLPHLKEASDSQFERHITFLNGSDVEVMHLLYEGQKLQEIISIPRGTNEQFLHFGSHGLRELRSKGIILGGFTRTLEGYLVERHPTAFHLFGVVVTGQLDFSSGEADPQPLPEKCTFLIPSGTHCIYRANRPTDFLWLHIDPLAFGRGIEEEFKTSTLISSEDFIDYCRHFRAEARNPDPDREAALGHLVNLIELSLQRNLTALGMNLHLDEARERLKKALQIVDDNLAANYSIIDIARFAGISKSRLYRDMQCYFNRSPGTILEEIRMRHARELLLHSDYKLEKIAEMTGYSDAFSFSRAFKRLAGCSPSIYRKSRP
jgi:AraC-like DNA-binding protein